MVNSSVETIDNAADGVHDFKGQLQEVMDVVEQAESGRHAGVTALFALPFITLALVVLGGICKLGILFRLYVLSHYDSINY